MEKVFTTPQGETIVVNYHTFSGKIDITYNGAYAEKVYKRCYRALYQGEVREFYVTGSYFSGLCVRYGKEPFPILEPLPWYSYILACLPLIMTMFLGNIHELAQRGFYYVGGFIGGGLSGLLGGLVLVLFRSFPKLWQRLLMFFVIMIATFLLCVGIGYLIVFWSITR